MLEGGPLGCPAPAWGQNLRLKVAIFQKVALGQRMAVGWKRVGLEPAPPSNAVLEANALPCWECPC